MLKRIQFRTLDFEDSTTLDNFRDGEITKQ